MGRLLLRDRGYRFKASDMQPGKERLCHCQRQKDSCHRLVGSPSGFPHCDDIGHQIKKLVHEDGQVTEHCMRTIHAEQNAICQAAREGISLDGATLYTRMTPCRTCAMLIINCGIKKVFCERKYHAGSESESMFMQAGIELEYKYQEIQQYQGRDLTS